MKTCLKFTQRLVALRRDQPVFRRRRCFSGRPIRGLQTSAGSSDGTEMSDSDWDAGFARSIGLFLNGKAIHMPDERGPRVMDDLTAREARYKENMAPTTRGTCAPIARHGALVVRVPQGDNAAAGTDVQPVARGQLDGSSRWTSAGALSGRRP